MTDLTLRYPAVIEFGCGARRKLPDIIASLRLGHEPRLLLVCIRTFVRTGEIDELRHLCGGASCGCYADVPHDPPLQTVDALIQIAREVHADAVVAVGGGSVIDAAKAAAVLAPAAGTASAYFHGQRSIDSPGLAFIALPTTAGTGAEITRNSVLTDPATRVKKSLRSPLMVPYAAVVDPELTMSCPPSLTAASGLDALTQAVESFLSKNAHAVSRALAAQAVKRLMAHLAAAFHNGSDADARTAVAEGSLLSALAFSQSGLGAVHGLAHPIGLALNLAHGLTCAILLPHILAWNAPACEAELRELAQAIGLRSSGEFTEAVSELGRELGIPANFAELGLTAEHFEEILANCRSGSMKANPRHLTDEDVLELLRTLSA